MYDVRILNGHGVWQTDTTTGSKRRAQERGKFLTPRVRAVKVDGPFGRVFLDDDHKGT